MVENLWIPWKVLENQNTDTRFSRDISPSMYIDWLNIWIIKCKKKKSSDELTIIKERRKFKLSTNINRNWGHKFWQVKIISRKIDQWTPAEFRKSCQKWLLNNWNNLSTSSINHVRKMNVSSLVSNLKFVAFLFIFVWEI